MNEQRTFDDFLGKPKSLTVKNNKNTEGSMGNRLSPEVRDKILSIKKENPALIAKDIQAILRKEFTGMIKPPSESAIGQCLHREDVTRLLVTGNRFKSIQKRICKENCIGIYFICDGKMHYLGIREEYNKKLRGKRKRTHKTKDEIIAELREKVAELKAGKKDGDAQHG